MTRTVKCPACGGPSLYAPENKWRPFCSERCRIADLGAWAEGRYRLPAESQDPDTETPAAPEGTRRRDDF